MEFSGPIFVRNFGGVPSAGSHGGSRNFGGSHQGPMGGPIVP